jgi:hypothetical protein
VRRRADKSLNAGLEGMRRLLTEPANEGRNSVSNSVATRGVIKMGMIRISYEQMEQLRECKAEMQMPLSRLVAEAVSHWLKFIASPKRDALRVTRLKSVSKEHSHHKPIDLGNTEARQGSSTVSRNGRGRRHTLPGWPRDPAENLERRTFFNGCLLD